MPDVLHQQHAGPNGSAGGNGRPSGLSGSTGSIQQSPFTVSRHKKVEIPGTAILNSHSGNTSARREPADLGIPYPALPPGNLASFFFTKLESTYKLFLSVSCTTTEKESNVLRKVASLTYDMNMEQKQASNTKMRMHPANEKHDLKSAETFEGIL